MFRMVRLITLVFLYINVVTNLNACVADDHDHDIKKIQESNAVARKTSPVTIHEIYVSPDSVRRFNNIFQKPEFWASSTFLSFKALNISCPQLFFNTISNKSLNAHLKSMHSAEPILNDITKLSNQILEIYGLKNQSNFPINFNLIYSYDQTILREALCSFLRVIKTPDHNRAQGYQWKTQSFARVFSQLCTSLNMSEEDTEPNLSMRKIVAFSLGLSPVNYDEWFQKQYPALAKWMKTCTCNNSKKPLAATLTLSFMHALTRKVNTSLLEQLYLPPMVQNENETTSPSCLIVCPIPRRPIPEQIVGAPYFGPYFNSRTPLLRPMIPSNT